MSRLRRNISSLIMSEVARRVFGFISVALMARLLGVDGFGQVMIGLTVLSYVALGGSSGLHMLGTRSVARRDVESAIDAGTLVGTRLAATTVTYAITASVTIAFVKPETLRDVILITSASAFLHGLFLEWYFQGKEMMAPIAAARTFGAFVYLVSLATLIRSPDDIRLAALSAVAGDVVSTSYLLYRYRALGNSLRIRFRPAEWRALFGKAIPFGIGSVLGHVSVNLPLLIIGLLLGTTDAGYFSAAQKLVLFLLMLDRIMGAVLIPASVRFHNDSVELLHGKLSEALRWTMLIGLPIAAGGTILSGDLVELVYGASFSPAAPLLGILVWYFLLTLLMTLYISGAVALGADARYRNVMLISAVLSVGLVSGGAMAGHLPGAATGLVVAEAITALMMSRALHPEIRRLAIPRFGRLVGSAALMVAVVLVLPEIHVLFKVTVGALTYGAAALTLKAVSIGEFRMLAGRFA